MARVMTMTRGLGIPRAKVRPNADRQEQTDLERKALGWWRGLSEAGRLDYILDAFGDAARQELQRRRAARETEGTHGR